MRLFLAAEALAGDRRMWIEMDKFPHSLRARERSVVARRAALSSVVQKPAVRPPRPRRDPGPDAAANYCNCGWPYHLLVPRGKEGGMRFRLLALLTDWSADDVSAEGGCGSLSFCGARNQRYPDRRAMGYPFDRPFSGKPPTETLEAQAAAAVTDVVIRFAGRL